MNTLTHASLRSTTADNRSLRASNALAILATWSVRVKQLFVIDFSGLDDLDLGTPKEFDTYICDLFERSPYMPS